LIASSCHFSCWLRLRSASSCSAVLASSLFTPGAPPCGPQHSTAQHSTAQHSTAQHGTAGHSASQEGTRQHEHIVAHERHVGARLSSGPEAIRPIFRSFDLWGRHTQYMTPIEIQEPPMHTTRLTAVRQAHLAASAVWQGNHPCTKIK
jgi:hypothetical protein